MEGTTMMTSELRYLLKTNSGSEGCSDQASLRDLLSGLRTVADDLDLNFDGARLEAESLRDLRAQLAFDPCI
jgi:hypothetical protein